MLGLVSTFGLPLAKNGDAIESPPPNLSSPLSFYTVADTKIGSEVRSKLIGQTWIQAWKAEAVEQTQDGRRVTQIFNSQNASYYYVYFFEDGAWKFHDIRLERINGVNLDLDLSVIIRDPRAAQGFILLRNGQLAGIQRKFVESLFQ